MKPSQISVNQKASLSLRISFRNEARHLTALKRDILMSCLKPSIQDMSDREFSFEIGVRYGEIILDLFFEGMNPDIKKLQLLPVKQIVLRNEATLKATLIFRNKPPEYMIYVMKKPNPIMLDRLNALSSGSAIYTKALSYISMILAVLVVCSQSGFGAPIMKIFKVFKLLSRLKLANVFFGAYLEVFLQVAGNLYVIGGDEMSSRALIFGANSKGKLKLYEVTALSVEKLAVPYAIFFTMIFIRIYTGKLVVYIDSDKKMSQIDKFLYFIGDKSRLMLMLTVGIDIVFYSFHCIAHLNLPIWFQHIDSQISLILSIFAVTFVFFDLLQILNVCASTKFLHTKIEAAKTVKLRKLFESKSETISKNPGKSEIDGIQEFVGKEITIASKDAKIMLLGQKAIEEFVTQEIKLSKLSTFTGRFFNIFGLIKLFLFEPLFVGLQMFPAVQICSLLTIQLTFLVFILKAGIKDQIFKSRLSLFETLVNELVILLFLGVGAFFHLMGSQQEVDPGLWEVLQYVVIGGIGLSIIVGLLNFLFSLFMSIWGNRKEKAYTRFVEEYHKEKELKELVRIRRYEQEQTEPGYSETSEEEGNRDEPRPAWQRYPAMRGLMRYRSLLQGGGSHSFTMKDESHVPKLTKKMATKIILPQRINNKGMYLQSTDQQVPEAHLKSHKRSTMFQALRPKY
jgi:hypothetical protein